MREAQRERRRRSDRAYTNQRVPIFVTNRSLSSWSRHGADAWRYLATAARVSIPKMRKPPEKKAVEVPPGHYAVPLDKLFEDRERERSWRRRRI